MSSLVYSIKLAHDVSFPSMCGTLQSARWVQRAGSSSHTQWLLMLHCHIICQAATEFTSPMTFSPTLFLSYHFRHRVAKLQIGFLSTLYKSPPPLGEKLLAFMVNQPWESCHGNLAGCRGEAPNRNTAAWLFTHQAPFSLATSASQFIAVCQLLELRNGFGNVI